MAHQSHEIRYERIVNKLTNFSEYVREDLFHQHARYANTLTWGEKIYNAGHLPVGLAIGMGAPMEDWAHRRHKLYLEIMYTEHEIDWVDKKMLEVAKLKEATTENVVRFEVLIEGSDFQDRLGVVVIPRSEVNNDLELVF
jgi:hypothetical protein